MSLPFGFVSALGIATKQREQNSPVQIGHWKLRKLLSIVGFWQWGHSRCGVITKTSGEPVATCASMLDLLMS
jgi:hypothetical protein